MAKKHKTKLPAEHWMHDPQEHDFPAAGNYLSLLAGPSAVEAIVAALKEVPSETRQAKDLLRASKLELLPAADFHVALDLKKVAQGDKLSPVLLVRGSLQDGVPLTIADGYHRICASYHISETADIPCRIVDVPLQAPKAPSPRPPAPSRANRNPRAT